VKFEDGPDTDKPVRISAGKYAPGLEAGAAYTSGTAPILFWMSTMQEEDVMGMGRTVPLGTNQRHDRDGYAKSTYEGRPGIHVFAVLLVVPIGAGTCRRVQRRECVKLRWDLERDYKLLRSITS